MSPDFTDDGLDPAPVPWADYTNPQSLNLYAYTRDNPLSHADDDGHDVNVCSTDANGHQQCQQISNAAYEAAQKNNGSLNVPTLDQVGNSKDANGNFTATSITDANGKSVGTATYVAENPGIDPFVGNNMAGLRTLATASATVGSVKGVAAFYGASLAGAACVVGCAAAATLIPEAANTATLHVMAYLESQGVPATAAAAMALKALSGVAPGKIGVMSVVSAGVRDIKEIAPTLNQMVRDYRQSQGAH